MFSDPAAINPPVKGRAPPLSPLNQPLVLFGDQYWRSVGEIRNIVGTGSKFMYRDPTQGIADPVLSLNCNVYCKAVVRRLRFDCNSTALRPIRYDLSVVV